MAQEADALATSPLKISQQLTALGPGHLWWGAFTRCPEVPAKVPMWPKNLENLCDLTSQPRNSNTLAKPQLAYEVTYRYVIICLCLTKSVNPVNSSHCLAFLTSVAQGSRGRLPKLR
jgi:hypothetical protein